jgi:hypothetical protein
MEILDGTNTSTAKTNYGKPLNVDVTTGWTAGGTDRLVSDILSLHGMSALDGGQTDQYVLSMSYPGKRLGNVKQQKPVMLARTADGNWVNAATLNFGGAPAFVAGAYTTSSALGTYGIDPQTQTAWAVLNYNGDFAVGMP